MRMLLVDDHPVFRRTVRLFVEECGILVVGEADNGLEAINLVPARNPDLVLMDISMPVMGGIEATRRILQEFQDIKVIVVSVHRDRWYLAKSLEAGASAYLVKDNLRDELPRAIDTVVGGGVYVTKAIP